MKLTNKVKKALNIFLCQKMSLNFIYWFFVHSPKLEKLKNIHKGEDCFIIGNGPSLNRMDLSPLNSHFVFGLNKIFLLFDRVDLKLSYHVSVNPLVIEQSVKEIVTLKCPSFLSYTAAKKIISHHPHIYFLATGASSPCFSEDVINIISEGWTVTYVALQLAFYMGFQNVFLIGVDHNFKTKGEPNELQILEGDDINHFDPKYFKGKEWHLPDLQGSEISYNLARFFFNRNGREIYDATAGGKLDVFKKIDFQEALKICRPMSS